MKKAKYKLRLGYWLSLAFVPIAMGVVMGTTLVEILGFYFGIGLVGVVAKCFGYPKYCIKKVEEEKDKNGK